MASTCSTSLVPIPKARAPKAPWVEVWLSPHTMVMPGWVRPSSGPMMCTIPWWASPIGNSRMPNSAQLAARTSIWRAEMGSSIGPSRAVVGTLWSMVATVRSGRRTAAPGQAQAVEGLGRGDLVDQVQVDVEQVGLAVGLADHVALPDLVGQGASAGLMASSHILR